jgi:hypothetical protein
MDIQPTVMRSWIVVPYCGVWYDPQLNPRIIVAVLSCSKNGGMPRSHVPFVVLRTYQDIFEDGDSDAEVLRLMVWVVLAYDSDFNLVAILFSPAATIDVTSCSDGLAAGFVAVPGSSWVGCSPASSSSAQPRKVFCVIFHQPRPGSFPKRGQFLTLRKQKALDIDSFAKQPRQTKSTRWGHLTFSRHILPLGASFWRFHDSFIALAPAAHLQGVFGYGSQNVGNKVGQAICSPQDCMV